MKNFLKKKMFKKTLLILSLAIMMVGGVFVYSTQTKALLNDGFCNAADATITAPATGARVKGTVTVSWTFAGGGDDCTVEDPSVFDVQTSHDAGATWTTVATMSNPGDTSVTFNSNTASTPDDTDYRFRLNNHGAIINTTGYSDVIIDNTAPTISSANITTVDGSYKAGQNIDITVTYLEAVNITNFPRLVLNVVGGATRYATYNSGTGSANIVFRYTVQAGDNIADLGLSSLTVDLDTTGTIKDLAGNDATSILPNDLTGTNAVVIDTAVPTLSPAFVVSNNSQPNTIVLNFNEPLEPVQAAINTNYVVTNNAIGITYGIASVALSNGNQTVTLTLNPVVSATNTTFITNTDNSGHIIVTPNAANIKDVALNPYGVAAITEAGGTHNLDSTSGTVIATLVRTSDTSFTVSFSEKVDKITAETEVNYTLSGNDCAASTGNPSLAVLDANGVDVVLTTPDVLGCHVTGASTVVVTPSASITDVAGVAITSGAATNTLADTTAPTIAAAFVVNNQLQPNRVVVTASEALNQAQAENTANWTITDNGGGNARSIATAVLTGGNVVTLTLATLNPATAGTFITNTQANAHIKVTMLSGVHDLATIPVASAGSVVTGFGETLTEDVTPATVIGALTRTGDTTFKVTFSEKVDKTTAETTGNYIYGGTCPATTGGGSPSSAVLDANGVDVVVTIPNTSGCHVTGADTVTVTPSASITDVAGVAITSGVATNTLADTTAPTISAAFVVSNNTQPNTVVVTASEAINQAESQTTTNWTVTDNAGTLEYTIASAVLSGDGNNIVTLTLAPVDSANTATYITNTAIDANIKVTMKAGIHDRATTPVASAASIVTEAGGSHNHDAVNATVTPTLAQTNATTFTISLSEKLNKTTAETEANYAVTGTCLVPENPTLAVLQPNGLDVVLTISSTAGCNATGASTVIVTPSASITDVAGVAITSSAATITLPDTTAPTITDAKITVTGNTGVSSEFKKGDTVTASWNNAVAGGDGNTDVASVTMDFSEFGGNSAVTATNVADVWSASYILPSDVNLTDSKVSVTAVDEVPNSATTADDTTYTIDTEEPDVTIASVTASPTNGLIAVTVVFDAAVTTFVAGDVTVTNGTVENFVADSDTNYHFNVNPTDGASVAVTIQIEANKAIDIVGNQNTASNILSYTSDTVVPTLPVAAIVGATVQGGNDTITLTFDGPVLPVDGTWSLNEFEAVESPNNTAKTLVGATFSPTTGATTAVTITLAESSTNAQTYLINGSVVTITPAASAIKDAAGNFVANSEVVGTTAITLGDNSAPTLSSVVYSQVGGGVITYVKPYSQVLITATFNEDMTNTPPTITIAAPGTVADVTAQNMVRTSATVWTYTWTVINDSTVEGTANITFAGTDLASNAYVEGGHSIVIDSYVPIVNTFTAGSITTTGAVLTVTTNEVATCKYANTETAYASMAAMTTADGTTHTKTLDSLTAGTNYNYYVRCADGSGNTMGYSAHTSFTTTAAATDTTAPTITGASEVVSQTGATISFTSNEAGTAKVGYGLSATHGSMTSYASMTADGNNSIILTGLTCGTIYHYTIYGKDALLNEANTADDTFTTSACSATAVITAVSAGSITNVAATISWTTDVTATSNIVEYGLTSALGTNSSADVNNTAHSVALSTLTAGRTYYYRVKSTAGGVVTYSNILSFTTSADTTNIAVDEITMIKSYATTDNTYANGWKWSVKVSVWDTDEDQLKFKLTDFASGANTIAILSNVRVGLTNEATGASTSTIEAATQAIGNAYSTQTTALTLVDEDPSKGGIQDTIYIYTKVPTSAVGGSFTSSYGIETTEAED